MFENWELTVGLSNIEVTGDLEWFCRKCSVAKSHPTLWKIKIEKNDLFIRFG